MSHHYRKLTKREKQLLLDQNPKIGDILLINREHPHTSVTTPFLHTDVLHVKYRGKDNFEIVGKDHIPYPPPQDSSVKDPP